MTAGPALVTDAVVLRLVPYAESDVVATLFTRAVGKVSAIARGARKSRRRFGASLALFVVGEAALVERRSAELYVLERFEGRGDFTGLAADVVALAHGAYATELVRELTAPRQSEPPIFELLVSLYETVAAAGPRADTLRAFELRLLEDLGLRPVLDHCLGCGAVGDALDRPGALLDPGQGGALCRSCAPRAAAGARVMQPEVRARLLAVQDRGLAEAAALEPAPRDVAAAAREAAHALLGAHLRGPLRSLEFIEQLRS